MTREEKLKTIVKLFAKNMFYGDWNWETPNERVITMLMQDVGLYPFKDEDEMILNTKINEDLYIRARNEISKRKTDNESEIKKERSPNKNK